MREMDTCHSQMKSVEKNHQQIVHCDTLPEYGESREGYWTSEIQIEHAHEIAEVKYPKGNDKIAGEVSQR